MASSPGLYDPEMTGRGLSDPELSGRGLFDPDFVRPPTTVVSPPGTFKPAWAVRPRRVIGTGVV